MGRGGRQSKRINVWRCNLPEGPGTHPPEHVQGDGSEMRARHFCATAIAVCIPAVVFAQRTKADPSGATAGAMAPSSSTAKAPSARDLQDLNPASLLIDKKKKASLPDSTVAQLKAVEKKIKERNASFYAAYDSVRRVAVPVSAMQSGSSGGAHFVDADKSRETTAPSASELASSQAAMRDLRKLMADFRDRRSADVTDALAVVADAQKKAATDLLNAQSVDLDNLIGKP